MSDCYLPKTHEVAKCKWGIRDSNEPNFSLECERKLT